MDDDAFECATGGLSTSANAGQGLLGRKTMHSRESRGIVFCRTMIMFPTGPFPSVRCGTESATNRIVVDVLGSFDTVFN